MSNYQSLIRLEMLPSKLASLPIRLYRFSLDSDSQFCSECFKSCLNLYKCCRNPIKIPYSPFQIPFGRSRPKFCCFFPQLVCVVHTFHCDSNQVIWTLFGVFSVWGNSAYWGKKLLLYFREQTFLPFSRKLNKVNQEMNLLIFQCPFELKSLNEAVEHDLSLKWCLLPLAPLLCPANIVLFWLAALMDRIVTRITKQIFRLTTDNFTSSPRSLALRAGLTLTWYTQHQNTEPHSSGASFSPFLFRFTLSLPGDTGRSALRQVTTKPCLPARAH